MLAPRFLKLRLYSRSRLFNVKFHFGHKIQYFKLRLYCTYIVKNAGNNEKLIFPENFLIIKLFSKSLIIQQLPQLMKLIAQRGAKRLGVNHYEEREKNCQSLCPPL